MNEPQILNQDQISNVSQITNETKILKVDRISNKTQLTNELQNFK